MSADALPSFDGAVLAGGASRRMGVDKALVPVDGTPMAQRAADALRAAGAIRVVAVGGDVGALTGIGLPVVPDRWPGEGPLGGVVTALDWATEPLVVIAGCDQPWLDAGTVRRLLAAHVGAGPPPSGAHDPSVPAGTVRGATVGSVHGAVQPLPGVYATALGPSLTRRFSDGARSLRGVLDPAGTTVVDLGDGRAVRDVDRPIDLGR